MDARFRIAVAVTCRRPIATLVLLARGFAGCRGQPSLTSPGDLAATLKVIWPCRASAPAASPPGSGRWCLLLLMCARCWWLRIATTGGLLEPCPAANAPRRQQQRVRADAGPSEQPSIRLNNPSDPHQPVGIRPIRRRADH